MTLKLALVIDGEPSGAKKALEETARGIESVGKAADATAGKTASVGKGLDDAAKAADAAGGKFQWLSQEAEAARLGLKSTGDEGKGLATSLKDVAPAADDAATGIDNFATMAGNAAPKFGAFKAVALGFISGIAGGLAGAALGAGIEAVTGKFVDLAKEIASDTPRIERDLKSHAELVRQIRGAYAEAEGAASSYGNNSTAGLRFEAQENITRQKRNYQDSLPDGGIFNVGAFATGANATPDAQLGPFAAAVKSFREDIKAGTADAIAFRKAVAEIAETLPEGDQGRQLATTLRADALPAAEVLEELKRAQDVLKGLQGDAAAAATALGGSAEKYTALGESSASASAAIGGAAGAIKASADAAAAAIPKLQDYDGLMRSIAGQSAVRGAVTPLVGGERRTEKFAAGGVVDRPTFFSFGAGQTGLMGEAGEEAILPLSGGMVRARGASGQETGLSLTRLSDGALGVEMPTAFAKGGTFSGGTSRFAAGGVVMSGGGISGGYGDARGEGVGEDSWSVFADSLKGGFKGILTELLQSARTGDFEDFWDNFAQIGLQIADRMLSHWTDQLTDSLVNALSGALGGAGSGKGIDLGGFDWGSLLSPSFTPTTTLGSFLSKGFKMGGHTGDGDDDEIAGVTHRNEFVVRAPVVAKPGVRQFLQALNDDKPAFRSGGFVDGSSLLGSGFGGGTGAAPSVYFNVENYSGKDVETKESTDSRGNRHVTMVVGQQGAAAIAQRGNPMRKALQGEFGLKQRAIPR